MAPAPVLFTRTVYTFACVFAEKFILYSEGDIGVIELIEKSAVWVEPEKLSNVAHDPAWVFGSATFQFAVEPACVIFTFSVKETIT
ncbi:hypothetical protein LPTSP2_01430 [Leptospira ellinghausenii]|uniref:Uncharacterized protein n=1 Tax=Leptospira ellinghausenii TaxID=1917822 RepID=A0A2P2D8C7_9LEPT|nr:hypothetical protein LPTSP2_01430 [Leptospira ellinghausenii]